MKTLSLPSIFKTTAVLLLFTLFGFQQANAQLNVINNTGCAIYMGEFYGTPCNPCNNPNGMWYTGPFWQIPVPACLGPAIPPSGWLGVKYLVAAFPSPFAPGGSWSGNPFTGGCYGVQSNELCVGNPVTATWLNANTVQFD